MMLTPSSSSSSSSEIIRSATKPLLQAEDIIRRSYRRTFGALSTETACTLDVDGRTCINSLLSEVRELSSSSSQTSQNNGEAASTIATTTTTSFPWWFVTMLRDIKAQPGIHGLWHNLTILDPPMDFCTIEKIATTQWRSVQCFLNEGKEPKQIVRPCQLNQTSLASRNHDDVSRVVMLRDPLERLLSGYLDKCAHGLRRKMEGHCESMSIFNETDMTMQIRENPKQLFAAYVDGFPLKWNIHFFPQSMYCDLLFRHADDYDFVGRMDQGFYGQLQNMASKFGEGNKLSEAFDKVFDVSFQLSVGRGNGNVGTETQALKHVKNYFTAASVRRALEYFAVDYIRLGLKIPGWVDDILEEENEMFAN